MAKPKRPSMLSRQRQLRAQQQQVRRASRNNLPPTGGSSGGNGGAISPRGSSAPATRGGVLTPSRRGPAVDQGVKPVRVRVMPPKPLGGGSTNPPKTGTPPRALPPGAAGGALVKARRPGLGAAAITAVGSAAVDEAAKNITNAYARAINRERSQRAAESGQRGRYVPGNQQVKFEKPAPPKKPPQAQPTSSVASSSQSSVRNTASSPKAATPSKPEAPAQSKNMEENYAAWTKANKGLAEKVKPNQAGYATIKKTLDELKIKNKDKK
jgi:hypothetical protein